MATLVEALQQQQAASRMGGSSPCNRYGSSPLRGEHPLLFSGSPAAAGGEGDAVSLYDLADFNDDLSSLGSPAHSVQSEAAPDWVGSSRVADDFKPRRSSFEEQRSQQSKQAHRFERRAFLPKTQSHAIADTPPPTHRLSPSPSLPPASPPPAYHPRPASPSPPLPLFPGAPCAPFPAPAHQTPTIRMPTLREQVLIRTSSSHSTDLEGFDVASPDGFWDVSSECVNFSDSEDMCAERELEKDALEGVSIVVLPCHLRTQDATQYVLYGLHFARNKGQPALPGDDSTRLLFPPAMQAAAEGKGRESPAAEEPRMVAYQPFKAVAKIGAYQAPSFSPLAC